ncbi:glycoside hydrolase family 26 protein [Streptacidiphilus monticola]
MVADGGPWKYQTVQAFADEIGRAPDVREYYQSWGDEFDAEGNAFLWQHGQLPMLAWVPGTTPLADIASGKEDAYIAAFARQVADYRGPLVLSFAGEFNGPWNPWGPGHAKPAHFVRAWRRVHSAFRKAGAANVIWTWTPHVVDTGTRAAIEPYFPGDAYVDWIGLIGYYGPIDGTAFSTLFTPTLKRVRKLSAKPVLIAETGVAAGPLKQRQIHDLFTGAAEADVIGLLWYDQKKTWPGSKQLMDWRIATSAESRTAVRIEAARADFGYSLKQP